MTRVESPYASSRVARSRGRTPSERVSWISARIRSERVEGWVVLVGSAIAFALAGLLGFAAERGIAWLGPVIFGAALLVYAAVLFLRAELWEIRLEDAIWEHERETRE